MVKIQTRVSRRHYLKAKRTYEYGRMSLDIPKKFHETIRPLLKQDFDLEVKTENGFIVITLSPAKAPHNIVLPMKSASHT